MCDEGFRAAGEGRPIFETHEYYKEDNFDKSVQVSFLIKILES